MSEPGPRGRLSRRTKITIFTILSVVVGLVAAGIVANAILASRYSPRQAVLAYLDALGAGNAHKILAALAPEPANVVRGYTRYLLDESGIADQVRGTAGSALRPVDPEVISTHPTHNGIVQVVVGYTVDGQRIHATYEAQEIAGSSEFVFYRDWKVVPPVALLSITAPSVVRSVGVDGALVPVHDGSATVALLPGTASVSMVATSALRPDTMTVKLPAPGDIGRATLTGGIIRSFHRSYCFVLATRNIDCWGQGGHGQLGDGQTKNSNVAVAVSGITDAVSVAGSSVGFCAVVTWGGVKCWGTGGRGQLGDGKTKNSNVPVSVSGISDAVSVMASSTSYCAVLSNWRVKCWGSGAGGQLGDGKTRGSNKPASVSGITNAVSVAAGYGGYCAVLSSGGVKCWGGSGILGDGETTDSNVPVTVKGITDAVSLTVTESACAVLSSGGVKCWGSGRTGILGDGKTTDSNVPVTVKGITDAVSLTGGTDSNCAVLASGGIKCWGHGNFGLLGDGQAKESNVPVAVSGITNAIGATVEDGLGYCAVLSSGGVECWGVGFTGQLGDGKYTTSNVPVAVSGITNAVSVTAGTGGSYAFCAVLASGGVECWGTGRTGQLGDGKTSHSNVPEAVETIKRSG